MTPEEITKLVIEDICGGCSVVEQPCEPVPLNVPVDPRDPNDQYHRTTSVRSCGVSWDKTDRRTVIYSAMIGDDYVRLTCKKINGATEMYITINGEMIENVSDTRLRRVAWGLGIDDTRHNLANCISEVLKNELPTFSEEN